MMVMVDRFSASALGRSRRRHTGHGPRSHRAAKKNLRQGHGQNANPINYRSLGANRAGQLNVTIGKYYRITGESTQDRGVTPDIALLRITMPAEVGEEHGDRACPGIT